MSNFVAQSFRAEPFRIGAVLSKSARIFLDRFFAFLAIALLFSVPGVAAQYAFGAWPAPLSPKPGAAPDLQGLLTPSLISLPPSIIGMSTLIVLSMQRLDKEALNVRAALHQALGRFFPVMGVFLLLPALIMAISVVVGIVVGVPFGLALARNHSPEAYSVMIGVAMGVPIFALVMIVACMFVVAIPACRTERLGVWDSMQRSRELTDGERWRVFGLLILTWLPDLLVYRGFDFVPTMSGIFPLVIVLVRSAFALIWTPFSTTVNAVTFHDLRLAMEGEGAIGGRVTRID